MDVAPVRVANTTTARSWVVTVLTGVVVVAPVVNRVTNTSEDKQMQGVVILTYQL